MLLCPSLPPPADAGVTTDRHHAGSPLCKWRHIASLSKATKPIEINPLLISEISPSRLFPNPLGLSCLFSATYHQKEAVFPEEANGTAVCRVQTTDGGVPATRAECNSRARGTVSKTTWHTNEAGMCRGINHLPGNSRALGSCGLAGRLDRGLTGSALSDSRPRDSRLTDLRDCATPDCGPASISEAPRPKVTLLNKTVQLSSAPSAIQLGDADELPQNGQLTFVLKSDVPASFARTEEIEVASRDESFPCPPQPGRRHPAGHRPGIESADHRYLSVPVLRTLPLTLTLAQDIKRPAKKAPELAQEMEITHGMEAFRLGRNARFENLAALRTTGRRSQRRPLAAHCDPGSLGGTV
jgi:hypothetical protein